MSPRKNTTNWSAGDNATAARLTGINQDMDDLYANGSDRGRIWKAASGTALKIDIAAFAWFIGVTQGQYGGGTNIAVTNSATNYVEFTSSNTIAINTTGWTAANARIGTVTCAGGVVTAISIWNPDVIGGALGGASGETSAASFSAGGDIITFTIPAGSLAAGDLYEFDFGGMMQTPSPGGTDNAYVKVGSITLGRVFLINNGIAPFQIHGVISCRTAGGSGTLAAYIMFTGKDQNINVYGNNYDYDTFDTTTALIIHVGATSTYAAPGYYIRKIPAM